MTGCRPLYRELAQAPLSRHPAGNAGLWYDKFCDRWNPASWSLRASAEDRASGKLEWIETLTLSERGAAGLVGEKDLIDEALSRVWNLLLERSGRALHMRTAERFVTGLGRSHPIENGFAWHQTLGTPYLAGSSVKGLVREWATQWKGYGKAANRILGRDQASDTGTDAAALGSVIFLDALPRAPVGLEPEVMTPHYAPYYQNGEAPGDWHSPVPIPFLAVAAGQPFLFALLPRRPSAPQDLEDCSEAAEWLCEALRELGAGAKTAVGLGRFAEDPAGEDQFGRHCREMENARRKRERIKREAAGLSEMAARFIAECTEQDWRERRDAFLQPPAIGRWLDRLEAAPDFDTLAKLLALFEAHVADLETVLHQRKGKKQDKPAYKPHQREIAQRLTRLRDALGGSGG